MFCGGGGGGFWFVCLFVLLLSLFLLFLLCFVLIHSFVCLPLYFIPSFSSTMKGHISLYHYHSPRLETTHFSYYTRDPRGEFSSKNFHFNITYLLHIATHMLKKTYHLTGKKHTQKLHTRFRVFLALPSCLLTSQALPQRHTTWHGDSSVVRAPDS